MTLLGCLFCRPHRDFLKMVMRRKKVAIFGICFGRSWLLVWQIKNPTLCIQERRYTANSLGKGFRVYILSLLSHWCLKNLCFTHLKICLSCLTAYLLSITKGLPVLAAEVSHYFTDTPEVFTEIPCALRRATSSSFHVVLCPHTVFLGSICTLLFCS